MWNFNILEDQDWYKRRTRLVEPRKVVSVEPMEAISDVPIRMIALFTDGETGVLLGRIIRAEEDHFVIQAINGKGDSLLCESHLTY